MSANHTPGPWKVCELAFNDTWRVGVTIHGHLADGTPFRVADVSILNPASEANARLIAAAPELLEALRKCSESALAYDQSIAGRAAHGEVDMLETGAGLATGQDLDKLCANWQQTAEDARALLAKMRP